MPSAAPGFRPKLLIVEDEFFIADDLARQLAELGAHVVGFAASLEKALEIVGRVRHLDVAVLDVRLADGLVFGIADTLLARGVCIVFYTATARADFPEQYRHLPLVEKPRGPTEVYAEVLKACLPCET